MNNFSQQNFEKVLALLQESKSLIYLELLALSDIKEEEVEEVLSIMNSYCLIKTTGSEDHDQIITLTHRGFHMDSTTFWLQLAHSPLDGKPPEEIDRYGFTN